MISTFLISLVAVGVFALGLYITGLGDVVRNLSQQAYEGVGAMTDTQLTDEEKEVVVRNAGISLFFGSWSVLWRFILCLSMTYLPIHFASRLEFASEREIITLMLRLDYIIIVSLALIAVIWLASRQRRIVYGAESKPSSGMGERILHMIAFASPTLQKLLARLDDFAFRLLHHNIKHQSPIFITSLARGGTTALLNALGDLPSVAVHTYRDMPFITAPYLWNRLSAPFRGQVARRTRAHGDGLEIDLDSPEAFDEVYWKLYWPQKYQDHRIIMWQREDFQAEAISRLKMCFQKIASIRELPTAHYLSKNNANVGRLRVIQRAFPDAHVIVPVRSPAPHAASLLRQHQNFMAQQTDDDFVRRYMFDIGHLEFGLLHTPIEFSGFDRDANNPDSPDYWLAYWIAAFSEVLANIDFCHIVLQHDLRSNANSCMRDLLAQLNLDDDGRDFTSYFRQEVDETDKSVFSPKLLAVAENIYTEVSRKSQQ